MRDETRDIQKEDVIIILIEVTTAEGVVTDECEMPANVLGHSSIVFHGLR